jgi:hypothetical protein
MKNMVDCGTHALGYRSKGVDMLTVSEPANLCAIRCWLMAKFPWPPGIDADQEQLRQLLFSEAASIEAMPPEKLIEAARAETQHDRHRSNRLLTWSWRNEYIRLADFGTWRTVGDALPREACRRSAVEAAAFVAQFLDGLPGPQQLELQARYQAHVSRIRNLARCSDVLRSVPLLSILAAERDHRGREECESLRFSCEDGSHRAIAMALAGHATISAWIAY